MISVRVGTHRFHLRAAAIIRKGEHLLLHRLEGNPFWALPGGRVHAGERAVDTLAREFQEELGTPIEVQELVCVGENYFEADGEPHHEVGLYFEVLLPPASPLRNLDAIHHGVEGLKRLEFRWFRLDELLGVDMRPVSLRRSLASGVVPLHFVQRD